MKTIKVDEITVKDCRGSSGVNAFDLNIIQPDVLSSSVIFEVNILEIKGLFLL